MSGNKLALYYTVQYRPREYQTIIVYDKYISNAKHSFFQGTANATVAMEPRPIAMRLSSTNGRLAAVSYF